MKYSILTLLYLLLSRSIAQLVSYPPPENITPENPNIFPSEEYQVSLSQNGKTVEDFVYCMNAMHTTNNSKTTSWSNFSFSGSVKVTVTKIKGKIDFFQVLPTNADIKAKKESDQTISFEISNPGFFSVEFEKGIYIEHPLLIFANPLEKHVPQKNDPNVIWFEPGFHEIGADFKVESNQQVYLEGGSYVKGQIGGDGVSNVRISGRGIISGEDYEARTQNHMIDMRNTQDIEIEGITMIHAPRFFIAVRGKDHHFHNLKMMGWWFSTDGISAGENALIEDCFFKVNDDAVKLYSTNTTVRNCTIWQLENGAPFMISWNGRNDFGHCRVSDIDIIRVEHHWDNENLAVVCAVHGGKANISDFVFDNIRIENSKWRMFHLVTRPNRWGKWDPEKGTLSNMTFRNFSYSSDQVIPNLIMGHDQDHRIWNIHFENIQVNGRKLTTLEPPFFIVDEETTNNITIE